MLTLKRTFIWSLVLCVAVLLGERSLAGQSHPFSLAECAVNLNGATTFLSRGSPFPPEVNLTDFDSSTGLGTISVTLYGLGSNYVGVLVDSEIEESVNTFYNEYATVTGTPAPGQSWEVDEPGFRAGNLQARFRAGNLGNVNNLTTATPDDVAVALAWAPTLAADEFAEVQVTVSETAPSSDFYLAQTDAFSGRTLFVSGTLKIRTGDVEPPTVVCPADLVLDADPGLCFRSNVTYEITATDNLPGVSVLCEPASGSTLPVGTTLVRCTATDQAGNTNLCAFNVTIRPPPPVITCPPNLIVECAAPGGQRVDFSVSAVGGCGSEVTLTSTPPSGSLFALGPTPVHCSAVDTLGGHSECSFTVFLVGTNCQGEFSLSKETCLAGEVHADPLLFPYPCGTCVQVTGVAAEGWVFMGWLGDARGFEESVTLTMTQPKCVEAVFGSPLLIDEGATHGVGWLDPAVSLYPCGSSVRALARPDSGYYFAHWTNALSGSLNPTDFTLAKTNAVLTPVFLPLDSGDFALTVETRGNGRVLGQPRLLNHYPAGSNVVLRALPDTDQTFMGWSFNTNGNPSNEIVTNNPITVEMNASQFLTASFTRRPRIEIYRCQGMLAKDSFRFQIHGKLLDVYAIQMAPSLDNPSAWRESSRATNVLGAVQYEDPYLPNVTQRFYRVQLIEP